MNWMPRFLLFAGLCLLPTAIIAQEATNDDVQQPAPGEPAGELESSDVIEAYERSISPIKGTAPDAETEADTPAEAEPHTAAKPAAGDAPDVAAQIEKLRLTIEKRLAALEGRIDDQVARLDALEATTIVANKPVAGAAAEGAMSEDSAKRDAEVAQLKADLDQFRSDISEQLQVLRETAPAESASPSADSRPAVDGHRLRIHNTSGVEQPITINGVQWTVRADEWSSVPIPRGPVTVHRPGQPALEVSTDDIDWQTDQRGYFFDYDLDAHRVARPAAE